MAADTATGRVVLFGGSAWSSGARLADTWTWDGTTWTQHQPPTSPSARERAVLATDPGTGHVVLFGGTEDGQNQLNDTWTWDGTTWTEEHPPTSPPARTGAVAASDPAGRVVLFGGYGGTTRLGDTWTWDGATWTQQTPAQSPPARGDSVMALDAVRHRDVLFSGTPTNAANDTWTWDGATWHQETPVTSPPPRYASVMAADPVTGRLVLFGGASLAPNPPGSCFIVDDTWTWDGTTWTNEAPPMNPGRRQLATMATDPNGRVVLFGGNAVDAQCLADGPSDTWSITPEISPLPPSTTAPPSTTTPSSTTTSTTAPRAAACAQAPMSTFSDRADAGVHAQNLDCISAYGLAQGFPDGTYRPNLPVTRPQMATFVARLLAKGGVTLPSNPPDAFPGDDAGPPHELAINQLAALHVLDTTTGQQGDRYDVHADMRRDDMAQLLVNAYHAITGAPLPAGPDAFTDDNGNNNEHAINALANAGVVQGTGGGLYNPTGTVTRGQMASFFGRFIQLLVDTGDMQPLGS